MTNWISVNVTVPRANKKGYMDILRELRAAGLKDAKLLEDISIVTGRIDKGRLQELKGVPGIVVEPDETVDVGPPDAPEH